MRWSLLVSARDGTSQCHGDGIETSPERMGNLMSSNREDVKKKGRIPRPQAGDWNVAPESLAYSERLSVGILLPFGTYSTLSCKIGYIEFRETPVNECVASQCTWHGQR